MLYAYTQEKILNIENIYLIKNGEIIDNLICSNNTDLEHTRHNGSIFLANAYFKLFIDNIKLVKRNGFIKAIKDNKTFIVRTGTYFDKTATYSLYLNSDICDFVESEKKSEYYKGDKACQKQFNITLKNGAYITFIEYDYAFLKKDETLKDVAIKNVEKLTDILAKREQLKKDHPQLAQDGSFYDKELKEALNSGCDYKVGFSKETTTQKFIIYSYVYKYEKTPERIKIEKLHGDIKKLIGDKLSIYDLNTLLENYKITKIRKHI